MGTDEAQVRDAVPAGGRKARGGRRRRWVGRWVCAGVAVALFGLSVRCTVDWRRNSTAYQAAEAAEIGAIEADFSRPGRYEIRVADRYRSAHGVEHVLQLGRDPGEAASAAELLGGLSGTMYGITAEGERFVEEALEAESMSMHDQEIILSAMGGGPEVYTLVIEIDSGAPRLQGIPQRLMAKNAMCGLEKLPGTIAGFFAIVCAVGGVVMLLVWWRLRRGWVVINGSNAEARRGRGGRGGD